MRLGFLIAPLLLIFLYGCASSSEKVALRGGFQKHCIQTTKFNLTSYQKIQSSAAAINVYIEGDGHVTSNHNKISDDPSPRNATVMQMATHDPSPNVIYLARPCQYAPQDLAAGCDSKYWTTARYSPAVITALSQALDTIKLQNNATKLHLIGYSGGGALAILIAAQRNDIASIRTVAGNLDLQAMQQYHQSDPLSESLDPIQVATQVQHIPQLHFVGKKDKVVPVIVAENFRDRAKLRADQVLVLNNVSHDKGWAEQWHELLKQVP